jgi:hypothetical protein
VAGLSRTYKREVSSLQRPYVVSRRSLVSHLRTEGMAGHIGCSGNSRRLAQLGFDGPRRLPAPGRLELDAHHNATDKPMAWIDGLDIPFR